MAKARDIVRMSEAEISAFLASTQNLQVATLGPDGAPHLTTVWFALHDGLLMFETYGSSQKVVNLRRDPRIAVLAEEVEPGGRPAKMARAAAKKVADGAKRLFA